MIVRMSDQSSDLVNEEGHQKEIVHINRSDFSNFLALFQTMESYQDFLASERSVDSCEWCLPSLDDRRVLDTSLCPCEINLSFMEGGDSTGGSNCGHSGSNSDELVKAINIVDDGSAVSINDDFLKTPTDLSNQNHDNEGDVRRPHVDCKDQGLLNNTMSADAVRICRSIHNTDLGSSNTNNSSLSRTNIDCDNVLKQSAEVAVSMEETASAAPLNQPGEAVLSSEVDQATNVTSLGEVPLYQSGRMLKLSKSGANRNRNFSENRRIPDIAREKCDYSVTKDQDDASSSKIQSSVIKKITPCDKNTFLCRPAIGSHDNFIEIRYKSADQENDGDSDRLSEAENKHKSVSSIPYYGSVSCLPTDDGTLSDIERRLRSSRLATNSLTSYITTKREERSSFWRKLQIRGINKLFTNLPSKNNMYQPYKCAQCCMDDSANDDRQTSASLANRPPITSYGLPCYTCLRHKLRKSIPNGNRSNNAPTSERGDDSSLPRIDKLLSDVEHCTNIIEGSGSLNPLGTNGQINECIHLCKIDMSSTLNSHEQVSELPSCQVEPLLHGSRMCADGGCDGAHQTENFRFRLKPYDFKTSVLLEKPRSPSSEMLMPTNTIDGFLKIRNLNCNNNRRSKSRIRNNSTTCSGKAVKQQPDARNARRGTKRKSQSIPESPDSKRRKISPKSSESRDKWKSGRHTNRARTESSGQTEIVDPPTSSTFENSLCYVCHQNACAEKDVESVMQCFMCKNVAHNDCALQDSPDWWINKPEDKTYLCFRCAVDVFLH